MKRPLVSAVLVLALAFGTIAAVDQVAAPPSSAATASQFNPEMIIADSLFYDSSAMSAADIQSFLNSQIGTCQNGQCLNVAVIQYPGRAREISSTGSAKLLCAAIPAGSYTAAQLIYATQVACTISAKVILVTLQKEQGLVTSRAPSDAALSHAMGMACPDTAPCDSAFAGLGTQIVTGSRQLKAYMINHFARQPGISYIGYSPNASCGGTNLNIRNYATAALYNYTPYQPDAAALSNLYGTGDGCSSYGNRNFWRYYTDWFGSTQGQQFITTTDGVNYLLAMDSSYELWAYPANGDGTWRPRVSLGPGWNGIVALIGAGDFDRNGHRDIIALDNAGKAWFYPGNGDLQYLTRRQLSVNWTNVRQLIYAGDFNNDGVPDVFTVDTSGELKLWPGTGTGDLGAPIDFGGGWNQAGLISGVGDLNGDGCPDLLTRPASGELILHRGDCAHGFIGTRVIGTAFGAATDIVSLGDFSGDGVRDIFTRDSSNVLTLFLGTKTGTSVQTTGQVDRGWSFPILSGPGDAPGTVGKGVPDRTPDATSSPSPTPTPSPSSSPTTAPAPQPGVGDVDGDGRRDIVGVTKDGRLRLYSGDGFGGFRADSDLVTGFGSDGSLVSLGDFTGDGRADLGRVTASGTFEMYPGKPGGFGAPTVLGTKWNGLDVIGGMDFDGDGKVDVIARDSAGNLWLYRGNGTGGWLSTTGTLIGTGWTFKSIFYAGDFNGSGGGDVMAITQSGLLYLYPTNGAGRWGGAQLIGSGWGGFVSVFSPGDFDGRTGTDVIARAADGSLYLYPGNGAGRWGASRKIDGGWNTMALIG